MRYLEAIPVSTVREVHLAGFTNEGDILIDTHGKPVSDEVWDLYRKTLRRFGGVPTLIEWDTDIPSLKELIDEAAKADRLLEANRHARVA